jgi:hypothetical protein
LTTLLLRVVVVAEVMSLELAVQEAFVLELV